MFLLGIELQESLGYSALEAGAAFFPITILMMMLSPRAGKLAQRIGPRLPMTVGPIIMGAGLLLVARVAPGTSYTTTVLPAAIVLGIGLSMTVSPLTAAVLAAVDNHHAGVGSGVNNAVARLAGLVAIAVLPLASGLSGAEASLTKGFERSMTISAVSCLIGGAIAFATIRKSAPLRSVIHPSISHTCHHEESRSAA